MDPVPSILNQGVSVTPLLSAFHSYNSGTADGKRFCSRAYDPDQKRSRLIWQRRVDNELIAEEPVEIIGKGNYEDARVFAHDGRNWLAFTEGFYDRKPFLAFQQLARLGPDWQPELKITIPFGGNGGRRSEKNWQFFSHEGKLHFVYSIVPHIVVELDAAFKPVKEYRSDIPLNWPWGDVLRGGTPPIRHQGVYITFFHSHTEHRAADRRYAMGAYVFDSKPPFGIRAISGALLRASDQDKVIPNPSVPDWNPLVVFPVGAWQDDGGFNVSIGVNDSFDAIARFQNIEWKDPAEFAKAKVRYFEAENGPLPLMRNGHAVQWKLRKLKTTFRPPRGYIATSDPNLIALIENRKDSKEINERIYKDYDAGR